VPESEAVRGSDKGPITAVRIQEDLSRLGVLPGDTLLVHSSLSQFGWVVGGPVAVVRALLDAVGSEGTIVMPSHTGGLSDPAGWSHPPVPEPWWQTIREHMPPFDKDLSPTRGMGAVVECFRCHPNVIRSEHPHTSFAALGPKAQVITANHLLESSLGEGSPLARCYELNAKVLLLGVGHATNTSLHLSEYRAVFNSKRIVTHGAPGEKVGDWREFQDLAPNSEDFAALGAAFEEESTVQVGLVGYASARWMLQRELVDFGVAWLTKHRS
jgi:aminoglycoside 3-N-acetyltransferase